MRSQGPLSAVERARIAYALMLAEQQQVARQRRLRERGRTVRFAVILAGMLAIALATAVYEEWTPWQWSGSAGGGFGDSRTGHVRSVVKGDTCQELAFNNQRGTYVDGRLAPCEAVLNREPGTFPKGSRVEAIRDAFTSR